MYEDVISKIDEMIMDQPHPYGEEETASAGAMWNGGYSVGLIMLRKYLEADNG